MGVEYVLLAAALILVGGAVAKSLVAYFRYRGPRVVLCPADGKAAAVGVDARQAGLTAVAGSLLRVGSCSRWPGRRRCGQMCLDQVEATRGAARIVPVLARWLAGRKCTLCGGPFRDLRWTEDPPGLMDAEGRHEPWYALPPDEVAAGLRQGAYRPVCWRCHVLETLRRRQEPARAGEEREAPLHGGALG
jgi:hypothetical protein